MIARERLEVAPRLVDDVTDAELERWLGYPLGRRPGESVRERMVAIQKKAMMEVMAERQAAEAEARKKRLKERIQGAAQKLRLRRLSRQIAENELGFDKVLNADQPLKTREASLT